MSIKELFAAIATRNHSNGLINIIFNKMVLEIMILLLDDENCSG
jgi:hypothetical protein